MRASICSLVAVLVLTAIGISAETHSDFNSQFNLTTLKTFDFKPQRRVSSDPIANNSIWGDEIRDAITANLTLHGLVHDGTATPDFLVAFYIGLRERYDTRFLGYGVPLYGPRFGRFRYGWRSGYDVWAVPYTESTLIIDVIDAHTNQLVWRGYNQDPINLGKAKKDFAHTADDVLKKFYSDAKKSVPKTR